MLLRVGQRRVRCRLALSASEHTLGLQDTTPLLPNEGLLFVWPHERERTFHMGRVAYPIDLAFFSPTGVVRKLVADARPGTSARWSSAAAYVLELPAGDAIALGLRRGAQAIAEPDLFMRAMVDAIVQEIGRGRRPLPWKADILNAGATESAVITKAMISDWLRDRGVTDLRASVDAAASEQGFHLLGDALVAGGIATLARQTPTVLVITREANDQRASP